jgi:hypothetical protein
VLLLAIQPMRVLGVPLSGAAVAVIVSLAVVCLVLTGLLRHGWAWPAGLVPQAVLIGSGFFFHASLTVVGVLFALVWGYVLHVRRTVVGTLRS